MAGGIAKGVGAWHIAPVISELEHLSMSASYLYFL